MTYLSPGDTEPKASRETARERTSMCVCVCVCVRGKKGWRMDRQVHACEVLLELPFFFWHYQSVCEELKVFKFISSSRRVTSSINPTHVWLKIFPHSSFLCLSDWSNGNVCRLTFHMFPCLSFPLTLTRCVYRYTHTHPLGTMSTSAVITCLSLSRLYKRHRIHRLINADQTDVTHRQVNLTAFTM